jgi:hypothetical protein
MNDNFAKELAAVSDMRGLFKHTTKASPPKPVGYWILGGNDFTTQFPMWVKPTPEQIDNHRVMLGWIWRDA